MNRRMFILGVLFLFCVSQSGAQDFMGEMGSLARLKKGVSRRASSSDPDWKNGNKDARPIPPGEMQVMANLKGPGVIQHIWNTIAASERSYPRLLVIRMYWDGEEHPSVEAPIGDFFGVGHGMNVPFHSLPITVTANGRARNCYWHMPFRKSARITVTNEGSMPVYSFYWYVDWVKLRSLPRDAAYFHAMYRQEHPCVMGQNYLIADIEGRGHYVGTLQNVRLRESSWYGEGDDFFFIDGDKEPTLRGTGSEDYFCDAWGFREAEGPYYGIPLWEGMKKGDRGSVFRWHIADPVIFTKSLRVEIEHKGASPARKSGFIEREDDMSTVAYWYQVEPHKSFPPMPSAEERLYFDFSDLLDLEQSISEVKISSGTVTLQSGRWKGEGQIFWNTTEEGGEIEIPFHVEKAGTYNLMFAFTQSRDYGRFQFYLDGEPYGDGLDMYYHRVYLEEEMMPEVILTAGYHILSASNVGKNEESEGYRFGIDGLIFCEERSSKK